MSNLFTDFAKMIIDSPQEIEEKIQALTKVVMKDLNLNEDQGEEHKEEQNLRQKDAQKEELKYYEKVKVHTLWDTVNSKDDNRKSRDVEMFQETDVFDIVFNKNGEDVQVQSAAVSQNNKNPKVVNRKAKNTDFDEDDKNQKKKQPKKQAVSKQEPKSSTAQINPKINQQAVPQSLQIKQKPASEKQTMKLNESRESLHLEDGDSSVSEDEKPGFVNFNQIFANDFDVDDASEVQHIQKQKYSQKGYQVKPSQKTQNSKNPKDSSSNSRSHSPNPKKNPRQNQANNKQQQQSQLTSFIQKKPEPKNNLLKNLNDSKYLSKKRKRDEINDNEADNDSSEDEKVEDQKKNNKKGKNSRSNSRASGKQQQQKKNINQNIPESIEDDSDITKSFLQYYNIQYESKFVIIQQQLQSHQPKYYEKAQIKY